MPLDAYRDKRDFSHTPEPASSELLPGRRFAVQKHQASRLHYDLRLEAGGVLKSWAVPKGPSLDPREKRLAIEVEDHPLDYAEFEGVIPAGQYGGGTVLLWDRGEWDDRTEGGIENGLRQGKIGFDLHGEKLRGGFSLVRTRGRENHWLLIKRDDNHARPGEGDAVLDEQPLSVKSGRDLDRIAADRDLVWNGEPESEAEPDIDPAAVAGAKKAPLPAQPRPMLATAADEPPEGERWLHEIKFDGYRLLCRVEGGRPRLLTRSGQDWTDRFPGIAAAAAHLPVDQALLDGEAVVLGPDGRSDFQALQNALRDRRRGQPILYAFDLLHLGGYDLTGAKLVERKRLLRELLASAGDAAAGSIRLSTHLVGRGEQVRDKACDLGVEGIVSKRANGQYQMGRRSRTWLKVRCMSADDFVIVGYTDPAGSRVGLGALLLADRLEGGRLRYAGKVGTGFDEVTLEELAERLGEMEQVDPPGELANAPDRRGVHWARPELVAEVAYAERTEGGQLRHPTFRGLKAEREADRAAAKPKELMTDANQVAGVALSSPDRIYYPQAKLTKRDLAEYVQAVAPRMLPGLADRPVALLRCPRGIEGACFFQKDHPGPLPEGLRRVKIEHSDGAKQYAVVESAAGLVALAQLGTLEIHPWGSRTDRLDRPDRLVLDLDPGPGVAWGRVVDAATIVRDLLDNLNLASFVRTTGGKGLHVVVPLERRHEWDEAKRFGRAVAESLEQVAPKQYTSVMTKAKRTGRIYVDYLRNSRGATAIASYSARARPGAPVATPVGWDELDENLDPTELTIRTVPGRIAKQQKDPWADMAELQQRITKAMWRKLGAAV
ncbi:MAG: DNA ligase D [Phycisphaeraceae bacterium]